MEKLYKYTVAGHTFAVSLPEGFTQDKYLEPYLHFYFESETGVIPQGALSRKSDRMP